MKTILFIATALFGLTAAAAEPLTGLYAVHTADCIAGRIPADAVVPYQIAITADAQSVNVQIAINYQNEIAYENLDNTYAVGTFQGVMMGGSTYKTVGQYSPDHTSFTHSEYDNQAPGLPLNLLRTQTLQTSGGAVLLTYNEVGLGSKTCIMSKLP